MAPQYVRSEAPRIFPLCLFLAKMSFVHCRKALHSHTVVITAMTHVTASVLMGIQANHL